MNRTAAEYKILPCYAHFKVYYQGNFIFSCDTIHEAEQEIREHKQIYWTEQKEVISWKSIKVMKLCIQETMTI